TGAAGVTAGAGEDAVAAGTLAFRLTGSGVRGVTEAVGGAGAGSGARRCSTGAGRCRGIQWVTVAAGADLVGADRVCTAANDEPEERVTATCGVARMSAGRAWTTCFGWGSAAIWTTAVRAAGGAVTRSPNAALP